MDKEVFRRIVQKAKKKKNFYCDSQSAIYFSKNSVSQLRSKHIDIRYH